MSFVFVVIMTLLLFAGTYCLTASSVLWRQNDKPSSYVLAAASLALYLLFVLIATGSFKAIVG